MPTYIVVIYGIFSPFDMSVCLYVGITEYIDLQVRKWLSCDEPWFTDSIKQHHIPIFITLEVLVNGDNQAITERWQHWIDFHKPLHMKSYPDVTIPLKGARQSRNKSFNKNKFLKEIIECYNDGLKRNEVFRTLHIGAHLHNYIKYVYDRMDKGEEIVFDEEEEE